MARFRVLVSFSGMITGAKGQCIDITDEAIIKDLVRAGYIEELDEAPAPSPAKRTRKKKTIEG